MVFVVSFSNKFSINLGSMPKTSTYVMSTMRKHISEPVKALGEISGSPVLAVACYWRSTHCIPAQTFASGSEELKSQPFTMGVRHLQACVCCINALHSLYKLDRQSEPSQRDCQCWKLQDQIIFHSILDWLHRLNEIFNMHLIGFQVRTTKWEWTLAFKKSW